MSHAHQQPVRRFIFELVCVVLLLPSASAMGGETATAASRESFFRKQVEPILVQRCLECHGSERKGGLDLRTQATVIEGGESGAVIEPGKPDESLLYDYVFSGEMPPNHPLASAQVATVKRWIEQGADYFGRALEPFAATTSQRAGYDWWSLQPLAAAQVPMPEGIPAAWQDSPIDRFVFAKLAANHLRPSAPAGRRALIRRLTYDLTGLPPTPDEVAAFIHDGSASAYEKVVDRLLASQRYGEQWGRHWLDVVRFGESNGFERNVIINNAWPFRDYIIRSFNADKPFDQLVLEHLAGDLIAPDDPDATVGTTFLVCGPYDNVGNQDPVQKAQIRANTIDEIIRATGQTFVGVTIGCSRCHNHKFDPITQRDYYGWYATFAGVHHGSRVVASAAERRARAATVRPLEAERQRLARAKAALERAIAARAEQRAAEVERHWTRPSPSRTGTTETFAPREARFVRLVCQGRDTDPRATTGFRIDEFEVWSAAAAPRNVALAKHHGKARGASRVPRDFAEAYSVNLTIDGRFGATWIAAGPTLTIELAKPETINRVVFSSDRTGAAGQRGVATFVSDYRIEISIDGKTWTEVANSHDRKAVSAAHRSKRLFDLAVTQVEWSQLQGFDKGLAKLNAQIAAIPPLPSWWVGTSQRAKGPFRVFLGGNPQRLGEAVVPASLTALASVTKGYRLTGEEPEAERRVALARWIIAKDNPLTPRVLANRLWHYHFGTGIVATPSDFGFMGGRPSHPELLDWLARQLHTSGWQLKPLHKQIVMSQTYRQTAAFREDAARVDADSRLLWRFPPRRLAAEEIRDTMLAVAGKLDLQMGGPGFRLYRYLEDNVATYVPLDQWGPETYRRAVYHQNARASRIDLISDFDGPDCALPAPRRAATTTPLQALTMMNHSFTLDMAAALAKRLQQETRGRDEPDRQIARAFVLCYARQPSEEESVACQKLVKQYGLRALCRVLLNSTELITLN